MGLEKEVRFNQKLERTGSLTIFFQKYYGAGVAIVGLATAVTGIGITTIAL